MPLFDLDIANILPYGGEVNYHHNIMSNDQSIFYFERLFKTIAWEQDKLLIFGKEIITQRKVAWYGNEQLEYTYSNVTKTAIPWTNELLELKTIVENITETSFNSCLLNLYHSGAEGMSWHSDDEPALGKQPLIASLSLGAPRKFSFKHKETKESVSIILEGASCLVMKGETQHYWKHALPKTKKVLKPRINLTFRSIKTIP